MTNENENPETENAAPARENAGAGVVNAKPAKATVCRMRGALLDDSRSAALDRILQYRGRTLKAQMERWIDLELQMIVVEQAEKKMLPGAVGRIAS